MISGCQEGKVHLAREVCSVSGGGVRLSLRNRNYQISCEHGQCFQPLKMDQTTLASSMAQLEGSIECHCQIRVSVLVCCLGLILSLKRERMKQSCYGVVALYRVGRGKGDHYVDRKNARTTRRLGLFTSEKHPCMV